VSILGAAAKQSDLRKMLLATGVGAVLGLQSCWLVNLALGISLPWYVSVWLFFSLALLGLSVGSSETAPWWTRGPVLGTIFSIPSLAMVWFRFDRPGYAIAVAAAYCSSGFLIAFFIDALFRRPKAVPYLERESPKQLFVELNMKPDPYPPTSVGQRLKQANAALERLDAERQRLRDWRIGQAAEQRIVWNELIELELQELDEQVSRICAPAAGHLQSAQPWNPGQPDPPIAGRAQPVSDTVCRESGSADA
jgi:hypothetical protein